MMCGYQRPPASTCLMDLPVLNLSLQQILEISVDLVIKISYLHDFEKK